MRDRDLAAASAAGSVAAPSALPPFRGQFAG